MYVCTYVVKFCYHHHHHKRKQKEKKKSGCGEEDPNCSSSFITAKADTREGNVYLWADYWSHRLWSIRAGLTPRARPPSLSSLNG